ncbi:MAG: glycosyltransferase family 4 protein, partial [Pseudomonadota bacterium]
AEEEFEPVPEIGDAADFLYIGMMRDLKGPDIFLEAFRIARETSSLDLSAIFVGDGEDKGKYVETIKANGLEKRISVHDAMPARAAFAKARVVVVPSRAESLPYLVLEAMAAQKPVVATDVGGIHEIFDTKRDRLVEPDNPKKLAEAMLTMHSNPKRHEDAKAFAGEIKSRFSKSVMAQGMERTYLSA